MFASKVLHEQHVILAYATPFKLGIGGYLPHKKAVAFVGLHLEGACKYVLGIVPCNNDILGAAVSADSLLAIWWNPVEQEMAGHLYAAPEEYPMNGIYQILVRRLYKYVTFLRIHIQLVYRFSCLRTDDMVLKNILTSRAKLTLFAYHASLSLFSLTVALFL